MGVVQKSHHHLSYKILTMKHDEEDSRLALLLGRGRNLSYV